MNECIDDDNIIEFEDWASDYFKRDNRYDGNDFQQYCQNSDDPVKSKSNYIICLRWRIIRRIEIIVGEYVYRYIRNYVDYSFKEPSSETESNEISSIKSEYPYIDLSPIDADNIKKLEKIIAKHQNSIENIECDLHKFVQKLPENFPLDSLNSVIKELLENKKYENIKNFLEKSQSNITEYLIKFKERLSALLKVKENCNQLSDKRNLMNILHTVLHIKECIEKIEKRQELISNVEDKMKKIITHTTEKRLEKIYVSEGYIYEYILKTLNDEKYENIRLLTRLSNNEWEILEKNDRILLLETIELLNTYENWNDMVFNIDKIKEKFFNPSVYRIRERFDYIYYFLSDTSERDIPENDRKDIENMTEKYLNKIFKKCQKLLNEHPMDFSKIIDLAHERLISKSHKKPVE